MPVTSIMMRRMRRRDFLLLAGGAVAWPVAARAEPMRRVGVLVGLAAGPDVPGAQIFLTQFREAMRAAGWVEGENVRVDYRFGGALNDLGKTKASAAELVALKPEVIYAQGLPACLALRAETTTIPIVFTQVIDPVGFGLAQSIGHPGGNVTGFVVWDFEIAGKWMQLLRELVPGLKRAGILYNPDTTPYAPGLITAAKDAAQETGIVELRTHDDAEIDAALDQFRREPNSAVLVIPEPFTNGHRDHIIAACARARLPAMISLLGAMEAGALMSYTIVRDELVRSPVDYVDRILKGASPQDLPIQAPRRYELVISLKAAKELGLEVPPALLARADRVIE
jgi:putative ABC transport system substrate-binding protein